VSHQKVNVDTSHTTLSRVEKYLSNTSLRTGGHWKPSDCKTTFKLALIIPYRDRYANLVRLLRHLHPFLMKQLLEYQVFVVEPLSNLIYNKALSMNAAFIEVTKVDNFDCFIFHDVDMLPENASLIYECSDQAPKHLVVALNIRNYTYYFWSQYLFYFLQLN
jgi:beta-1,4-galactosyltransferase 1